MRKGQNKRGGRRKIWRDRKDVGGQVWREKREQALREGVRGAARQVWWDRAGVVGRAEQVWCDGKVVKGTRMGNKCEEQLWEKSCGEKCGRQVRDR